jgi:hypothetical protein
MSVIPVNRVVDKRKNIGKNGWPRRKRATRGCCKKVGTLVIYLKN